jgi:hypothetical protein
LREENHSTLSVLLFCSIAYLWLVVLTSGPLEENETHSERAGSNSAAGAASPFAVRRITAWIKNGADMNRVFRVLSAYTCQVGLASTERYLFLTPERFFDRLSFSGIVLHGKAQMGEVWDHPNRKKVWLGFGGVYSAEGGFSRVALDFHCPPLQGNFQRAVDRGNLPKSRIFGKFLRPEG